MQFTPKERRQLFLTGKRDAALYPYSLQFYKDPPTDIISLEEFEELALERLKGNIISCYLSYIFSFSY